MGYSAIGVGVTKNADNTITVKAQIRRDEDGKSIEFVTLTGPSIANLKAQLQTAVDAKVDAEKDQALNAAIVGIVLVTSK